jgi:NAD(P)-dependent dehydrogenase (short-subunit alcohol dehydrogenase family)
MSHSRNDDRAERSVCVITGGSRGIGLATAIAAARSGFRVTIVVRTAASGERALQEVREAGGFDAALAVCDLGSLADIRNVAAVLRARHPRINVLVLNAGIFTAQRSLTVDGLESQFAVNHLSSFLLTHLLLDPMRAAARARIVVVASQVERSGQMDFDDLMGAKGYEGLKAYAQSKLANVMFTYELSDRLKGTSVTVNALHPGVVRTSLLDAIVAAEDEIKRRRLLFRLTAAARRVAAPIVRRWIPRQPQPDWAITSDEAAAAVMNLVASPALDKVGGVFFKNGVPTETSPQSHDLAARRRLWRLSAELTGLSDR